MRLIFSLANIMQNKVCSFMHTTHANWEAVIFNIKNLSVIMGLLCTIHVIVYVSSKVNKNIGRKRLRVFLCEWILNTFLIQSFTSKIKSLLYTLYLWKSDCNWCIVSLIIYRYIEILFLSFWYIKSILQYFIYRNSNNKYLYLE